METTRLETLSESVLAIVLTIRMLELPAPDRPALAARPDAWPVFVSIYWDSRKPVQPTTT